MSVLLIVEHNNKELKSFTLNAVTAASQIDSDVHALVIGNNCGDAAKAASELPLVKKVITVEAAHYENFLAENFAPVVTKLADNYSHVVCSANTFGKNLMPRIAAKLDTSQVSDIIKVESQTLLLDLFMQEMLLQLLKVLMQKNVLLLDQLLLNHVKVLAVQHQLKLLKQVKNFH